MVSPCLEMPEIGHKKCRQNVREISKKVTDHAVSLTLVTCKLLEGLFKDHMVDFLVRHKLLNPSNMDS